MQGRGLKPKSECRMSKETRSSKSEGQTGYRAVLRFGLRASGFVPESSEIVRFAAIQFNFG
jgi:hypothetical protein